MPITQFIAAKKGMPWTYRIKVIGHERPTQWSNYLVVPKEGFMESYNGPIAIQDIEYIEINPYEQRFMGRMNQDQHLNHTQNILELLISLDMNYKLIDQYITVYVSEEVVA